MAGIQKFKKGSDGKFFSVEMSTLNSVEYRSSILEIWGKKKEGIFLF